jgi:hypothetical protein
MKAISRAILALLLAPLFYSHSYALPEEAVFGLKQSSMDYKRIEMEQWLETRLSDTVVRFVPQEKFAIYADIEFKSGKKKTSRVSRVKLSKLGTVQTIVHNRREAPKNGLFGKVQTLKLTLVVDKTVEAETVDSMLEVMRERVPVIEAKNIETSVLRMTPPGQGIMGWWKEVRGFLATILLAGIFCFTIIYVLRKTQVRGQLQATPINTYESNGNESSNKNVFTSPSPLQDMIEHRKPRDPAFSILPKTRESIQFKRIRTAFRSLGVEECVELANRDLKLASIMEMALPSDKAHKVFSLLTDVRRKEIIQENMKWDEAWVQDNAMHIIEQVKSFKTGLKESEGRSAGSIATYIEQVGPASGEEDIYQELIDSEQFDVMEQVAKMVLPNELVMEVPNEFIWVCLQRIDFRQRVELIAHCEENIRKKFLTVIQKHDTKSKMIFDKEVKQAMGNIDQMNRSENLNHLWGQYVRVVRDAYNNNPDLQRRMLAKIDKWLHKKTNGMVGQHGQKSA